MHGAVHEICSSLRDLDDIVATQAMDRRDFLKTSGAALVAAMLGPFVIGSGSGQSVDGPSRDKFAALLGTWFGLAPASGWLQLVALNDGPTSRLTEQFTLVFRSPSAAVLPEGVYQLTAAETREAFEVFLQAADGVGADRYYAGVFNLLRPLSIASCGPPSP